MTIKVTITQGVEVFTTECEEGDTIQHLMDKGMASTGGVTTTVNQPGQTPVVAAPSTALRDGDEVNQAPKSAKLG